MKTIKKLAAIILPSLLFLMSFPALAHIGKSNPCVSDAEIGKKVQQVRIMVRLGECNADSIAVREKAHNWAQSICPQHNRPIASLSNCQAIGEILGKHLFRETYVSEQCCQCEAKLSC